GDDSQAALGRGREQLGGALQLRRTDPAGLVPPGPDRVQADDEETVATVDGLCRFPLPLELAEGSREAGGESPRDVVVTRDHEQRSLQPPQKSRRTLVLLAAATVGEIAAGNDQLRLDALDQCVERALDLGLLDGADMQVRE